MPPKKARFGRGGKRGGKGGKGDRGYGSRDLATAGATITVTETTGHPGETIMIALAIGEIEAASAAPPGIWEDEARGATAPRRPPHPTHVTVIGL